VKRNRNSSNKKKIMNKKDGRKNC